jgi:hypothetical protein
MNFYGVIFEGDLEEMIFFVGVLKVFDFGVFRIEGVLLRIMIIFGLL